MTVRAVLAGQLCTFASADRTGWVRRPAPHDGLLIETDADTLLVPVDQARAALDEIARANRKRGGL